jgi:hypothetical protein
MSGLRSFAGLRIALAGGTLAFMAPAALSQSLATSYVDVFVDPVPPDTEVNLVDALERGLRVQNRSRKPVTLHVDVLPVPASSLRAGAAALPDVRWIQVRPNEVRIPAEGEFEFEVSVRVPSEPSLRGKTYAFQLLTSALPQDGATVEVSPALLSKVSFRVPK